MILLKKTIPEIVLEILAKVGNDRKTAKQIFDLSNLPEGKSEQIRLTLVRLEKHKDQKVVKDGKRGREYLYSLKDKAESSKVLLKQLYEIMSEDMKVKDSRIEAIQEKIPILERIKERVS